MSIVLINGRAYDHTQVIVTYLGVPLPSVTSLDYGEEQDKSYNNGVGNRPVSLGLGAIAANGSIEMSMNDVEAIRDAAPDGSLLLIAAGDMVITFINPQKPLAHTIKNLVFTNDKPSTSEGDMDIKVALDFIASNVKWR